MVHNLQNFQHMLHYFPFIDSEPSFAEIKWWRKNTKTHLNSVNSVLIRKLNRSMRIEGTITLLYGISIALLVIQLKF